MSLIGKDLTAFEGALQVMKTAKGVAAIKDFMRQDIACEPDLNWHMTNTIEDGRFVAFE